MSWAIFRTATHQGTRLLCLLLFSTGLNISLISCNRSEPLLLYDLGMRNLFFRQVFVFVVCKQFCNINTLFRWCT